MDYGVKVKGYEEEIVRGLEPFVQDSLKFLIGDKRTWWASTFFSFMEQDECFERLREMRKEAKRLLNEDLVALVGNTVTEDALTNYAARLANLFPDPTGTSQNPWNVWVRGWTSEEWEHGKVLYQFLLLTGRVNMKAVNKSTSSLIERGMKDQPDIFRGLVYPAFQELATARSHGNMAKIAGKKGAKTLQTICRNIAMDESRHAKFYSGVVAEIMKIAPEEMILAYSGLMKDGVVMPARNMVDDIYTKPPILFKNFAGVANKIGMYTTRDYSKIITQLNKAFRVADANVSGDAAEAQEYLCRIPERLRKLAEITEKRVAEPVEFDWIYGKAA